MNIWKYSIVICLTALLLGSCSTPNVSYFSDLENNQTEMIGEVLDIKLRNDDKISIVINSKDPLLADLFNLPVVTHRIGYTQEPGKSPSQSMSVYTVDTKGEIDFPVLGKIRAAGLRREELAASIKSALLERDLILDPVVTIEYTNLGFNVLGEVNHPGRYSFDRDHLTLLDAISMAGDLTIQGKRQTVFVMRGTGDRRTIYRVNLLSGKELLQSPAYYLQQDDVVYVEPNSYRSRQTTVNGNNVLSAPFWISVASLLTSIAVLIFK